LKRGLGETPKGGKRVRKENSGRAEEKNTLQSRVVQLAMKR